MKKTQIIVIIEPEGSEKEMAKGPVTEKHEMAKELLPSSLDNVFDLEEFLNTYNINQFLFN